MKICALLLGLMLVAAPAFAADVDGEWNGTVNTPNGDVPVTFTFKAEGDTLTGAMLGMDGMKIPIQNGKIDGANISFSLTLDFGGMALELAYKGVVSPSEIKLNGDAGGFPFEFVVKKAE